MMLLDEEIGEVTNVKDIGRKEVLGVELEPFKVDDWDT